MTDSTEAFDPDQDTAYAVIGKFVAEFARAEAFVHLLACRRSGLGDERGRIIFNGMRFGDLAERLRGLMRLAEDDPGEFADMDSCLTQLDLIGKQRHKIAHRYVNVWQKLLSASNLYISKSFDSHETDVFSLDQLNDMIADCERIRNRILRHTDGESRRREKHDPDWLPELFAPWRYNLPKPEIKKQRPIRSKTEKG
jgi:hypothetical protein